MIAVCAPGGGKSIAYEHMISNTLDRIFQDHNVSLGIETYTTAGLQVHQKENGCSGLITSDEGHRILAQINSKQSKNEAEWALLCKLWGGRGDKSLLLEKSRGFEKTSMSMALFLQPEPLMKELSVMEGNDGFLERMVFFTCKPHLHTSQDMDKAQDELDAFPDNALEDFYTELYAIQNTKEGKLYKFSPDAQRLYRHMQDEHARAFNALFSQSAGNVTVFSITFDISMCLFFLK